MTGRIEGVGASGGIAIGPPVVLHRDDAPADGELRPLDEAIGTVTDHYESLAEQAHAEDREEEAEVLEAYVLLVGDPSLRRTIDEVASEQGLALDEAVRVAGAAQADELAALQDEYLSQRAEDLRAAVADLVTAVRGRELDRAVDLPDGAVVVAAELTPVDTSQLDITSVGGFAIAGGGTTSHTAIVARSHDLPAVVGAQGVVEAASGADVLLVDGDRGTVVIDPDRSTRVAAEERAEARRERRERARRLHGTAVSFDGERVHVAANVGDAAQLAAAVEARADGVGLYRTEFLHLGDTEPPSREDQAATYAEAAAAFEDPVIVRTLDIGGDKESRWLDLPEEENPFLGVRGLRLTLAHPDVLRTQFRALLDVDEPGLRVMLPMVATLSDLRRARQLWDECVAEAARDPLPFGIMVETPAAALLAPHLAAEVDFLSIGTNDLTQYASAADRGLASLSAYHDPVAPPVLQLIRATTSGARGAGIPVGVCGAAAADTVAAVLLLGLGVRELSVPPSEIDVMREVVDDLDADLAKRLATQAVDLPDADAVRELVTDAVAVSP